MNMKRMRGRSHRGSGNNNGGGGGGGSSTRHMNGNIPLNRNHVFDSIGPDGRVRGTAQQLYEKYQQLGRDASSAGDRVAAEGFYQHAEHYFRILSVMNQAAQQNPQQGNYQRRQEQGSEGGENGENDEGNGEQPQAPPGLGDQPSFELREIPISAEPPVDA